MSAVDTTFELQNDLVMYCRTGEDVPKTTKQKHTFHYRRLVYNVVRDTLKKGYPLFIELFGKENFEKAVQHFYATHKCKTPHVWQMPKEFCEFYTKKALPFEHDCPFVAELLLFEWIEIEVFMMEDEEIVPYEKEGNVDEDFLVSNPEIRIMPLTYPIHNRKITHVKKEDKGQYFVAVVRNPETKRVKFRDINYAMAEILVKINDEPTIKKDLLPLMEKYKSSKEEQLTLLNELMDYAFENYLILGHTQPTSINLNPKP